MKLFLVVIGMQKFQKPNRNYQLILDWLQEEPSLEIIKTKPTRAQSNSYLDYVITNIKSRINIHNQNL